MMKQTALLVVDMQTGLIEGHPYNEQNVINNIKTLLLKCREKQIEVIYVRHDDGVDSDLAYGSDAWEICKEIAPRANEKIFNKSYNSAFRGTGLREYLDNKKIDTLILVGMQTEYCIDATCKVAFEYGYHVIIPENTITTFDNALLSGKELSEYYTNQIWNNRFAVVKPLKQIEI